MCTCKNLYIQTQYWSEELKFLFHAKIKKKLSQIFTCLLSSHEDN